MSIRYPSIRHGHPLMQNWISSLVVNSGKKGLPNFWSLNFYLNNDSMTPTPQETTTTDSATHSSNEPRFRWKRNTHFTNDILRSLFLLPGNGLRLVMLLGSLGGLGKNGW